MRGNSMNVHQMQVNLLILGLFLAVVPHISRGFIFESRNMYAFFKGYFGAMGAIVGVPSGWLLAQDLAKEQLLAGSMFFIGVYFLPQLVSLRLITHTLLIWPGNEPNW